MLVAPNRHGWLHSAECYLALWTTLRADGLHRELHVWQGRRARSEQVGVADHKAGELEAASGGVDHRWRQQQGFERAAC